MLHEKIDLIMKTLNAGNKDIAKQTNYSPTSVSRLKTGSRSPEQDSPTIANFVMGAYLFALETDQIEKLCILVECNRSADSAKMCRSITAWLFSEESSSCPDLLQPEKFGNRLGQLMELADMTVKKLSLASDTDYSYLLRMKKNERFPKSGSESVTRICTALLKKIKEDDKITDLCQLTEISRDILNYSFLRDWLCGYSDSTVTTAIRKFLRFIENISLFADVGPVTVPLHTDHYYGDEGLREAVVSFLGNAMNGQVLWLYSDAPMDWMTGNFLSQWASLISGCLKKGVHIRIIHNIERKLPEMLSAIQSWMPLYMTGLVEPFYSELPPGDRFEHTIFINHSNYAVYGICVKGEKCRYSYITDDQTLDYLEKNFEALISQSSPLLNVSRERQTIENGLSGRYGNSEIFADDQTAIVNRLSEPCVSFQIRHPKMVEAIHHFLKNIIS